MKRILSSLSFVVLLFLVASSVPSFALNDSVVDVHVEKAVAIPSKVLVPGNYVFRLLDSSSRPHDVEVMSADGKTFYGIIPVYETSPRDSGLGNEITITAPDESGLARINSWYFPGSQYGYRFIYSKSDIRKADMVAQQMKSNNTEVGMQ